MEIWNAQTFINICEKGWKVGWELTFITTLHYYETRNEIETDSAKV